MTLTLFTLALDAEPYIERHLPIFEQLKTDWHWYICHGAAMNNGSTAWCKPQKPRLSTDGTTEYLASISDHPNITLIERKEWDSKDEQCNAALAKMKEPCFLVQIDSDEIWKVSQLDQIARLFDERAQLSSIMFPCRYFVGPTLILRGENCYGDHDYEWLRAWRYVPGRRFVSHEPPALHGDDPARRMPKAESRSLDLIFDHHAYATEEQCAFKEKFYGYCGLVNQWRALQHYFANRPAGTTAILSRFFPHVKGNSPEVVKI